MSYLFCSHKFHINVNYFTFQKVQNKCEPIDIELEILTEKIVTKLSEIRVWGPGSIKKLIPDPGVKRAPDPGSGTLVTNNAFVNLPCSPISVLEFFNNLWGLGTE